MTGAMYAAISGLKTHMSKLNVVGHNIANVNTFGYKAQRAIFADSLYTMTTAGSNGTPTMGGRNPSQLGYGVQMTTVDINMSTGSYAPTGNDMDCMIYGQGFFMVGNKEVCKNIDPANPQSLKSFTFSRVGNIDFKADGYLTKEDGGVIHGFMCIGEVEGEPIFSDQLVPIHLPRMKKVPGVDANGDPIEMVEIVYPTANGGAPLADNTDLPFANLDGITIDPTTGRITATATDTGKMITIGVIAFANVTNPNGMTHLTGSFYKAGDGAGDVQVSLMGGIGKNMYIGSKNPDPAGTDKLTTPTSPTDPTPKYTHGFLGAVNGSMLKPTQTASDDMKIYESGSSLQTGGLESSKTDLATEISEMITTQRGYQANTRIITVTDSMLEELVNMKR